MDLVKRMLDKYGIPDPVTSNAWGVYQDPAFTRLAVDLVMFGLRSPTHALGVGAQLIYNRALGAPIERPKSVTTRTSLALRPVGSCSPARSTSAARRATRC